MNDKAIFEIGNLIHIRYGKPYKFLIFGGTKLTAQEIIQTFEYKQFKKQNPELCGLAEENLTKHNSSFIQDCFNNKCDYILANKCTYKDGDICLDRIGSPK